MALFFFFFMTLSIPALSVWERLHNPNAPLQSPDVITTPTVLFHNVGLPLSAAAFVVCFVLALRKFRREEQRS